MMIQINRVLTSLSNGPWVLLSVVSRHEQRRWTTFKQFARKTILNYAKDLSLLTSLWLARYIVWREMRRRRRQS